MAVLTISKTFADTQVLFEADLDAMKSSIETAVNTTKLNDDNFQNSGITANTKVIDGTITSSVIADETITADLINSAAVTTAKLEDGGIGTDDIDTNAVTAAKIAANGVPRSAIHALNMAEGTAVNATAITSTSVPSAIYSGTSVSFTPSRSNWPVFISFDGSFLVNRTGGITTDTVYDIDTYIYLFKDDTRVGLIRFTCPFIPQKTISGDSAQMGFKGPVASWLATDLTAGVSYTFGFNVRTEGSSELELEDARLVVWEIP